MKCVNCGNETTSNSKYCSVACKSRYLRKKHKTAQTNAFVDEPFDESKHQLESTNKSPELYTRFDGRQVPLTEAELLNEGIDWLKSKFVKKPSPQIEEPARQLTVTDLANLRAKELNGEILPSQFESFTPSSYEQQVQSQPTQVSSRPTFNVTQAIRSVVSRIFPQKKQPEFPDNTYNEWGQPLFHWKCWSCNNWVSTNDVAIHQAEGHSVVYVG